MVTFYGSRNVYTFFDSPGILFNFIVIIKKELTILTCGLVYAITNFWLCTINDLFRVIISTSLVNITVCAICCNLDSQITPSTEDLQASTNLDGVPRSIEDKAVVNHRGFGSYKKKQVKSSINHSLYAPRELYDCIIVFKNYIA